MAAWKSWLISRAALLSLAALAGCTAEPAREVIVYTAHDEPFSAPILREFEQATGIKVRAVYDTEASKTTGLVNRLIAEKSRPRADVFWNNEVVQTIRLRHEDALEPYRSSASDAIPEQFRDPESYWTGFSARARVLIYNTDLVDEPPAGIDDLLDTQWRGKICIARPLFGTTATQGAALFALWGRDRAIAYFDALLANDVAILAGNSTVRDLVARGEYAFGLTDTDDANGAVLDGFPVKWVFPDQGEDGIGTLVIPNTVALIAGAPNAAEGKILIDFLLRAQTEETLAQSRSLQIPLRSDAAAPASVPKLAEIRAMDISFEDAAAAMSEAVAYFEANYVR